MSYEDHSDDVASDFRDALEGLTMNSRVEITTLTVIARENTEYAHAISEVLQDHIKKVTPPRKLPALYLLDSIVKNVGTPYTLYFSRGLYTTFMDAYASVDNNTRRKMDEMLKTWKEPVPGSVDSRPVFSPETVRPIENALIKARTSVLQAQQQHMRSEQMLMSRNRSQQQQHNQPPYRQTPTPPGGRQGYPSQGQLPQQGPPSSQPPQTQQQQQTYPIHPAQQASAQSTPQPPQAAPYQPPTPQQQPPFAVPGAASRISIESLNEDIGRLIGATKTEFAEKSYDASVAARLKALLDLQMILKSQNLEYDKLILVKNQIDALSVNLPGHLKVLHGSTPTQTPPTGYAPYQPPPAPASGQPQLSAAVAAAAAAALAAARSSGIATGGVPALAPAPAAHQQSSSSSGAPGVSIDSLLGKGALAALLASRQPQPGAAQHTLQPTQIPQNASNPAAGLAAAAALLSQLPGAARPGGFQTPLPQQQQQPIPQLTLGGSATGGNTGNPLALMDMLRKSGLLNGGAAPAPGAGAPPAAAPAPISLAPGLASVLAAAKNSGLLGGRQPFQEIPNGISFSEESLKVFRPHLLPLLYEELGPPCTQCGRRFKTDEAGRAAKTAHMDWHFRVHQRIVEAEKRGQHRSWYVDPADWIRSRDILDADQAMAADGDAGGAAGGASGWNLNGSSSRAGGSGSGAGGTGPGGKVQWIPVPSGAGTNQVCPICQERFEMKWLDEAQEWVWTDAVQIGPRVYHASCHAEATKGGASRDHPAATAMAALMSGPAGSGLPPNVPTGPSAGSGNHGHYNNNSGHNKHNNHNHKSHNTPEPVLGKRKAEDGGKAASGQQQQNGNGNANKAGAGGGRSGRNKKKRGGAGGGGGRRPPDLDRVDPDIGGGGPGGVPGGRSFRNGKRGGLGGAGAYWSDGGASSVGSMGNDSGGDDAKVDLNALPY